MIVNAANRRCLTLPKSYPRLLRWKGLLSISISCLCLGYLYTSYPTTYSTQLTSNIVLPETWKINTADYPPTTDIYDSYETMRSTAQLVRDRCQILSESVSGTFPCGTPVPRPISKTLVKKEDSSLLFTPLPKCGWSSWLGILYQHFNVRKSSFTGWAWNAPYHLVHMKISSLECSKDHSFYTERLVFVRNPYERLVSGYKNKALEHDGLYVKTYRNPCGWLTRQAKFKDTILTFKRFVSCILQKAKNRSRDLSSRAAGIHLDQHWAPQFHLSLPCSTNYTLIGKYEHFSEDVQAIIAERHLNATLGHQNKSPDSLRHPLDFWYKQLAPQMIVELQQLYKYDFEVFGYNSTLPLV